MRSLILSQLILALTIVGVAQQRSSEYGLEAYPPAEKGQVRYVWHPPQLSNETDAKVELIVGKTIDTDGVNRYTLKGNIVTETIKGWGYDRYIVVADGGMIRTLIGVPPGTPRVEKFVKLGGPATLVRYNSRLPVVVYAPEGLTVRFRVWRPEEATIEGEPG